MATSRLRAFSSTSNENQAVGPNPGGVKRMFGEQKVGRSALGELKNTIRLASTTSNDGANTAPLKPLLNTLKNSEKENACSEVHSSKPQQKEHVNEEVESMEVFESEAAPVIEDPDVNDRDNPQLVVEYVNDIYAYLRSLETSQRINSDYLGTQKEILPKMRAVLVDWLVGVHTQFHLLQETLYTTVAIMDRYLQEDLEIISRKKLQLVGVASMLVAAKYEEIYAPEVKDFVYITDRAYTEQEILRMELRILQVLKFNLGRPLPLHFLRRASKAGGVEAATHALAKYLVELSLVQYSMVDIEPSRLAAAALALSLKILDKGSNFASLWSPTLVHFTRYNLEEIYPTVSKLAEALIAAPSAKLDSVYRKYCNKKFMKIARLPSLEEPFVKEIAEGQRI